MSVQDKDSKYFHLIAIAKNENGRIALNKLITKSNFEGFYYKPRIDLDALKPYGKDLVISSACLASKLSRESDYNKCIEYIEEYKLDALTLRCWNEMETILRVCPCVLISELNDRGIPCSCEIDLTSAITMRALQLASGKPSACLDWNNNYGEDENKVILFHCGPVAQSLMAGKGTVTEHKMFAKGDPGSGWGTNEGRIAAFGMTFANGFTEDGKLKVYASEARFTGEPIEGAFFGCGGVAEIPDLQNKLIRLAKGGFKHHTTVGVGHWKAVLEEAFKTYLGYEVIDID